MAFFQSLWWFVIKFLCVKINSLSGHGGQNFFLWEKKKISYFEKIYLLLRSLQNYLVKVTKSHKKDTFG